MKGTSKYIFLFFAISSIIAFILKGNITYENFDSEKWKNWKETETQWSLRWDMMNSLRKKHQLKGKTKLEIIELLGEPDAKSLSQFVYYLGMAKHGIDIGNLSIKFYENETVEKFKVRRS